MSALIFDDSYPEILQLVAIANYDYLSQKTKLTHQQAAEAAYAAAEAVRLGIGGGHAYIPKGAAWELSARDREIYAKFDGRNYDALARAYNLTEMRVRQIVTRCREADIRDRQSDIFGADNANDEDK